MSDNQQETSSTAQQQGQSNQQNAMEVQQQQGQVQHSQQQFQQQHQSQQQQPQQTQQQQTEQHTQQHQHSVTSQHQHVQEQQAPQQLVIRQGTPVSGQVSDGSGQQVTPQALIINATSIAQHQQAQNQAQLQQVSLQAANLQQQQLQQTQQLTLQPSQGTPIPIQQLQVIPNLQNPGSYVQFPQGQVISIPANYAVQQPNGQYQLISQPKQIPSNQLATNAHMFTTQGKQVLAAPGQPTSFSGFTSTNSPQAIVMGSLPANLMTQSLTGVTTSKQQDLQKYNTCATNQRSLPQNTQSMQMQQWQLQALQPTNMWATSSQPTFLTTPNSIYFRGASQQDGSGQVQQQQVYIQSPPPQQMHHAQTLVQNNPNVNIAQLVSTSNMLKRPPDNIQPKVPVSRTFSTILPSSPSIRAGSSVSTQTTAAVQMTHMIKSQPKPRLQKSMINRANSLAAQKSDAANQAKQLQFSQQQQMTSHNKMVVGGVQYVDNKNSVLQQMPPQMKMQASPAQQQLIQQQIAQSQSQQQTQQTITYQQSQQLIQPKPPQIIMTTQGQQQLQIQHLQQQNNQQLQQQIPVMPVQQNVQQIQQQIPVMPVVSVPTIQQQCQAPVSHPITVMQPSPQQQQQQQQQVTQSQTIVCSEGNSVTLAANTPASQDENQSPQPISPPVIPPAMTPLKKESSDEVNESQVSQIQQEQPLMENTSTSDLEQQLADKAQDAVEGMMTLSAGIDSSMADGTSAVDENMKDKSLPKALVKPQILTHIINGHIIQESSEPFPVYRSSHMPDLVQAVKLEKENKSQNVEEEGSSAKKQKMDCGCKPKSKRYCSPNCSKRTNASSSKKPACGKTEENGEAKTKLKMEWESNENNDSGAESTSSPSETQDGPADVEENVNSEMQSVDPDSPRVNLARWTVADVSRFIRALPGCSDYAEDFEHQEIDGQALMLLKADHLMSAMSMKLGPALKIVAKIDSMREESQPASSSTSSSQNERA